MKKQTKREIAIASFCNKAGAVVESYKGATIISWNNGNNPVATIYTPFCKGVRPAYNYSFRTEADRDAFIADKKAVIDRDTTAAEERKAQYAKEAEQIVAGTILYSSWGYDQTNIDFYKVLSRKGMAVELVQIGSKVESYNDLHMSGRKVADESVIKGEVMKKRINKFGGITINSFASCSKWDGRPLAFSDYA